ncbi:hypothetical protein DFH09DRAFT_1088488 [Mycena vulgaris]|nr:hypothetical protein DFH09DRAFT_1088488 [Mycena vulgaris]
MPAMLRGEKRRGSRRNPARNPIIWVNVDKDVSGDTARIGVQLGPLRARCGRYPQKRPGALDGANCGVAASGNETQAFVEVGAREWYGEDCIWSLSPTHTAFYTFMAPPSPQYGDRAVGSRFEDVRKVGQGVSGKAIYRVNWMARGADRRDKGLSQVADAQSQRKSFHAQQNKKSEGLGVGWTERNIKTGVSPEDWSAELEIVDGAKGEKAVGNNRCKQGRHRARYVLTLARRGIPVG